MTDLPEHWRAYARLQEKLDRRQQVDDYAWGLEDGLNRLLEEESRNIGEIDRAVRSGSRRERYQQRLRRIYLAVEEPVGNPVDTVDARRRLRLVKKAVTPEDWSLLNARGEGYDYEEIATSKKMSAGTLRARVHRLRRTLVALAS
jgi:hypothetical protein